ncbi:hypothetical protein CTZ27_12075 [Streptomyces griseocarneus]|nr:hypothetical protein CTZ27_12075 [Streptomyces griseocarneus]
MSKRFALEYSQQASRALDDVLKNDPDRFRQIVAVLRTFADNPYASGAPRLDRNGLAKLRQRGLFKAECFVAGSPERGGTVTTIKLLHIAG